MTKTKKKTIKKSAAKSVMKIKTKRMDNDAIAKFSVLNATITTLGQCVDTILSAMGDPYTTLTFSKADVPDVLKEFQAHIEILSDLRKEYFGPSISEVLKIFEVSNNKEALLKSVPASVTKLEIKPKDKD